MPWARAPCDERVARGRVDQPGIPDGHDGRLETALLRGAAARGARRQRDRAVHPRAVRLHVRDTVEVDQLHGLLGRRGHDVGGGRHALLEPRAGGRDPVARLLQHRAEQLQDPLRLHAGLGRGPDGERLQARAGAGSAAARRGRRLGGLDADGGRHALDDHALILERRDVGLLDLADDVALRARRVGERGMGGGDLASCIA